MSYKVDSTILEQLEYEINAIPFNGIPIGHTLSYYLYVELFMGKADYSSKAILKDHLLNIYYYYVTPKWARTPLINYDIEKGTYLFTLCEGRNNFLGIVKPVTSLFDNNNCTVLGYNEGAKKNFNCNYIPWSQIPGIDISAWRKEVAIVIPSWKKVIDGWIKKNSIQPSVRIKIINTLIIQSLYLESFIKLLREIKPAKVVTETDRLWFSAPLITAANHLGIPTISLLHGVINNRNGYIPLIANKIIVWGERQKSQLVEYGLEDDRILIGGAPHLHRERVRVSSKQDTIQRLKLTDKPVVILGSAFIDMSEAKRVMRIFCEGLNACQDIQAIVKLHHSESKEIYQEEIAEFQNIIFCDGTELNFDDAMSLADIICVYNSAFGTDALIYGHPVIVLDIMSPSPGNAKELMEQAHCLSAKTSGELYNVVQQYFTDNTFKLNIQNHIEEYVAKYCKSFGADATHLTYNLITSNSN